MLHNGCETREYKRKNKTVFRFLVHLHCRPKVVGTLELYRVSPFPPNQCWKISRFFQQKGQSTLKVGGGENFLRVPTLCFPGL